MAMRNCALPAANGLRATTPCVGFPKKASHAKTPVAMSTSQGTSFEKKPAGVSSNRNAPTAPPARLMTKRARKDRRSAPDTIRLPTSPVVTWPGKRAIVEVMFAARASSLSRMSAGRVTNEPPPASAF